MKSSVRNENKFRVSSIYSRFTPKQTIYVLKRKDGARRLLQTNSPGNQVEMEKIAAGSNPLHPRRVRSVVLKCFDIFKHLRGLKSIDKIKKCRRDIPRDCLLTVAVGIDLTLRVRSIPTATVSKQSRRNHSRYSLLY